MAESGSELVRPAPFDESFMAHVLSTKEHFVDDQGDTVRIRQPGAAVIEAPDWPGWPAPTRVAATSAADAADEDTEAVIETFVVTPEGVEATGGENAVATAWRPLAAWMSLTVQRALHRNGAEFDGTAYVTASLTAASQLEGQPHLDDTAFSPTDNVGLVAIVGQHVGPRAAVGSLDHGPLRPGQHVDFGPQIVDAFAGRIGSQCVVAADQLVVLAQFGQLHAGPSAHDLVSHSTRQLLVLRARVRRLPDRRPQDRR